MHYFWEVGDLCRRADLLHALIYDEGCVGIKPTAPLGLGLQKRLTAAATRR